MQLLSRLTWILLSIGLFKLLDDLVGVDIYLIYMAPTALILLFGLPHGATDHMLNNFINSKQVSGRVTFSFITLYFTIIFVYAAVWYLSPEVALLIFLFLSAYHFGETQWIRYQRVISCDSIWLRIHNFTWGVFLLGALFSIHEQQTLSFLSGLINDGIAVSSMYVCKYWIVPISMFITSVLSIRIFQFSVIFEQVVELMVLIMLFWFTELIYAFAIFFTLFHSRDTVVAMMQIIKKETGLVFEWKSFYKHALPFTVISLFGIGVIMIMINQLNPDIHLITLFFVMISLITAPHMWVIEQFYSTSK